MIVRDFYFAAWLITTFNYDYTISDGTVTLDITKNNLSEKLKIYTIEHKPFYDTVKTLVKNVNRSRVNVINKTE